MNGLRAILKTMPVFLWLLPNQAQARLVSMPNYKEMLAKSDLVVIANPITTTADTKEHSFLPDIWRQEKNGEKNRIESIGVETVFTVCAVLKGDTAIKQFTLHHYREAQIQSTEVNGPGLVYFDPSRPSGRGSSYLLFLVREPDGRYAPVGGQTDPSLGSISPIPFGFRSRVYDPRLGNNLGVMYVLATTRESTETIRSGPAFWPTVSAIQRVFTGQGVQCFQSEPEGVPATNFSITPSKS